MVRITTVLHGCVRVERSFSTAFPFFLTRQEDPPRLNGLEEVAVERLLRYTRVLDRWSGSVGTFPRELPLYQRRGVATPSSGFLHSMKNFHTGVGLSSGNLLSLGLSSVLMPHLRTLRPRILPLDLREVTPASHMSA